MGEMRPKCHDQEQKRHVIACYVAVHDTFPRFTLTKRDRRHPRAATLRIIAINRSPIRHRGGG